MEINIKLPTSESFNSLQNFHISRYMPKRYNINCTICDFSTAEECRLLIEYALAIRGQRPAVKLIGIQ